MLSWESHSGYWLSCGRARTGRAQAASRMRGSVPALSHVIIDRFDFKQSALERFAIVCRRGCATGDRLGPHEAQTVDKRPFCAVQQYAFGLRGMPRFKGYCEPPLDRRQKQRGRDPLSVSARSSGRTFRSRPCSILRDRDGWQVGALSFETKYYRVIRRTIRSQDRW